MSCEECCMMDVIPEMYRFSPFKIVRVIPTDNCRSDENLPKPRSGHRIVANSGSIYSFGGYNPIADTSDEEAEDFVWNNDENSLFRELWRFNIATKIWKKIKVNGHLPEQVASHAAVLVDRYMMVFGGSGLPFGAHSSNSVHVFNVRTKSWYTLDVTGELPLQQYGQAIAMYDDKLYAVGGTSGYEYSIDIHCLDLKTRIWSLCCVKPPFPEPRYRHEVAVYEDKLFVFGGGTSTDSFTMHKIPVFNFKTQMWETKESWGACSTTNSTMQAIPEPRRCHGLVQIDNNVYISGGLNDTQVFSDIWRINLKTLEWVKLPVSLPQALFFHATAATPEGQMFIFGGVSNILNQTRTNNMYSIWLKIPSLKEMCWEAIHRYIPKIGERSNNELLYLGIPRNFVQRLRL